MKNIDLHVVWSVVASIMFLVGMWFGEDAAAVKLQPCPQPVALQPCPYAGKAELINATVTGQVCQYAEIVKGGRKIKWSVKTL